MFDFLFTTALPAVCLLPKIVHQLADNFLTVGPLLPAVSPPSRFRYA